MLWIPQQTVEAAYADIRGSLYKIVVKDAIASGVEGYDDDIKKSVRQNCSGLALNKGGCHVY